MATQARPESNDGLAAHYLAVRGLGVALAAPLSDADASAQPMPDASPAKWHLAHTTWFFETFVLRDHLPGYRAYDESFAYLFNSYYEGEGERHPRAERGKIARPSLDEVRAWRAAVDAALLGAIGNLPAEIIALGLNHEQQHQELMLMDLTATMFANPLNPAVWERGPMSPSVLPGPIQWIDGAEGVIEVGNDGVGFAFDCEGPRHKTFLRPHTLADRTITNAEWLSFIADGGYANPLLWLSDGWAWARENGIEAPLYWVRGEESWSRFALDGLKPLEPAEPVCHISYFEAEAYARWAGARLPTEAEWESAAASLDSNGGNQLDVAGPVRPFAGESGLFGNVWEWTGSAYLPYPGFAPAEGAVGEYNGKFMCSQMVLRGGCCATPRGHVRASYRNFYYPHQRWMYSGLRLARDC